MQTLSLINRFTLLFMLALACMLTSQPGQTGHPQSKHLVIVDSQLEEQNQLTESNSERIVISLPKTPNPLQKLAEILQNFNSIETLSIVSHGSDGGINLGGVWIDENTLLNNADALTSIQANLTQQANIQLFGCDVAATDKGKSFINTLAILSNRHVAASNNATGHQELGGDWKLEYQTGHVVAQQPFSVSTLEQYRHTLSHFRGGSITWQAVELDNDGQRNDVIITVKTAWRYNSINGVSLASSPNFSMSQIDNDILYVNGNASNADYALQTTLIEARNLDLNTQYLVSYTGCCRISNLENNEDGNWDIQSWINLNDGNLAPKIDLPIIFEVPKFQSDGITSLTNWTFDLGSTDPNADKLRYRLANLTELGGGSSTNPSGFSINPNTGLLTWSGSGALTTGLYSGGIVAEDVDTLGNNKSKTHVDFILDLQPKATVGYTEDANIPETHNIIVDKGTTFAFSITGIAIETTSLGDLQGALSEPSEGNFVFDPGNIGSGLVPAAYPITFEIRDTNGTKSKNYLVLNFIVPDPDAPRIDNIEADRTTYSTTVAQLVDENLDAVVSDVDNTHFNGGSLKFNVTFTDGQYEVLSIESIGDEGGEIRLTGSDVFYEGNLIGSIDANEDGVGRALRINFTSNDATIAAVQALIRSLTYEDTFTLRSAGDRSLSIYFEDPDGHSNSYNFFIDVQDHPAKPAPGGGPVEASNRLTIVEGQAISLSNEDLSYADPDAGDTITLTVSSVMHGQFELVSTPGVAITTFTQQQVTLGQIAFAHDGGEDAPSYSISASDGSNPATPPSAADISFTNANDAPDISGAPSTTATENSAYSFTPTLNDPDVGNTHTFSINNKPAWASFDTNTGQLSGTPGPADVGNYPNILISVTDNTNLSDSLSTFTITVSRALDTDGDGVPDYQENAAIPPTDPNDINDFTDTDNDGVPDYVESYIYSTDPNTPDAGDTDGDGVIDYAEVYTDGSNPNDAGDFKDTDNDGVPDYVEINVYGTNPNTPDAADTDGDGVTDYAETYVYGSDPNDANDFNDTDNDGVPDYIETHIDGSNPNDPNDYKDTDNDGVPDYIETYINHTDHNDPHDYKDTDHDGVPDYVETHNHGTDPNSSGDFSDTDNDGVPDYVETHIYNTNPNVADAEDTDGDGVIDYVESYIDNSDPNDANDYKDTDNDGVPDYVETHIYNTNPNVVDAEDTDGDGVIDYVESYVDNSDPNDANDYKDTDGDHVPDYVETRIDHSDPHDRYDYKDTDGDGVSDYYEIHVNNTDPNDSSDMLDSDGDGVSDYLEELDGTDPHDINDVRFRSASVNATGLYTRITHAQLVTLGLVDAADAENCCDNYARSAQNGAPLFPPGRNRLTWAGNGSNILNVQPLVSLSKDQIVTEGQTVTLRFWLNGLSPVYPLVIPYTVGGTAGAGDHNLSSGSVSFSAGQTATLLSFQVTADSHAENDETIVISLENSAINRGSKRTQTILITEGNIAPDVQLEVRQNGQLRSVIARDGGMVVIRSDVIDPNTGDAHHYAWTTSGLGDTDNEPGTFTFNPTHLAAGIYKIHLNVSDDGNPIQSGLARIYLSVVNSLPVLGNEDSDGDGISDASEGLSDSDGDGIPDYLDAIDALNVLPEQAAVSASYLVECDPSARCRLGLFSMQGETGGAHITDNDFSTIPNLSSDPDYDNIGGIFDFEGEILSHGQSLQVVIPQRQAIPANARYRKFNPETSWFDFAEDANNRLYSTAGEAGYCPPPGDDDWEPGLQSGHWCVQLLIEDGGPNDADNEMNRIVVDPGGIGQPASVGYITRGGNGGGALHWTMLILLLSLLTLKYRHAVRRGAALLGLSVLLLGSLSVDQTAWAQNNADNAFEHPAVLEDNTTEEQYSFLQSERWNNVYLTGHLGSADSDVSMSDMQYAFVRQGTNANVTYLDSKRQGWGLGLGYRLSSKLAMEFGYLNLDKVRLDFTAPSTALNLGQVHPESGEGYTISSVYHYPIKTAFKLQTRLGLYVWEADYATHRSNNFIDDDHDNDTNLYWGLGGGYRINDSWTLLTEFQRFHFDRNPTEFFWLGVEWWPKKW